MTTTEAVWTIRNPSEKLFAESVLMSAGIPYFLTNEHLGSILIGPQIRGYNEILVRVPVAQAEEARALLESTIAQDEAPTHRPLDRFRGVSEVLFFGWIMPGRGSHGHGKRALTMALSAGLGIATAVVTFILLAYGLYYLGNHLLDLIAPKTTI